MPRTWHLTIDDSPDHPPAEEEFDTRASLSARAAEVLYAITNDDHPVTLTLTSKPAPPDPWKILDDTRAELGQLMGRRHASLTQLLDRIRVLHDVVFTALHDRPDPDAGPVEAEPVPSTLSCSACGPL